MLIENIEVVLVTTFLGSISVCSSEAQNDAADRSQVIVQNIYICMCVCVRACVCVYIYINSRTGFPIPVL